MKSFYIVALALVACAATKTYDIKNEMLDIKAVVADKKKLEAFVDCLSDQECNQVSAELKKNMAEAIQQSCAKCTPDQKELFKVFLDGFKANLPAKYEAYRTKYDPENKYFPALEAAIA